MKALENKNYLKAINLYNKKEKKKSFEIQKC
jgi:hypothetical protein